MLTLWYCGAIVNVMPLQFHCGATALPLRCHCVVFGDTTVGDAVVLLWCPSGAEYVVLTLGVTVVPLYWVSLWCYCGAIEVSPWCRCVDTVVSLWCHCGATFVPLCYH